MTNGLRKVEAGFHWIVGRKKNMIRRSGENIAAREVESVIREIPRSQMGRGAGSCTILSTA